jgi:hypothetical protein
MDLNAPGSFSNRREEGLVVESGAAMGIRVLDCSEGRSTPAELRARPAEPAGIQGAAPALRRNSTRRFQCFVSVRQACVTRTASPPQSSGPGTAPCPVASLAVRPP